MVVLGEINACGGAIDRRLPVECVFFVLPSQAEAEAPAGLERVTFLLLRSPWFVRVVLVPTAAAAAAGPRLGYVRCLLFDFRGEEVCFVCLTTLYSMVWYACLLRIRACKALGR